MFEFVGALQARFRSARVGRAVRRIASQAHDVPSARPALRDALSEVVAFIDSERARVGRLPVALDIRAGMAGQLAVVRSFVTQVAMSVDECEAQREAATATLIADPASGSATPKWRAANPVRHSESGHLVAAE